MKRLTLLFAGLAGLAGGFVRADLPPAQQAMVDHRLAAVARGDFQTNDPDWYRSRPKDGDAAIFQAMGHAEAKITGRELRAINWLASYLADEPQAPDRAGVLATIKTLDATSRARIERLVQSYEEAVKALPPGQRDDTLREVVRLWAQLREDDRALATIGLIQGDGDKSDAISSLIETQTTRPEIQYGTGTLADTRARLESVRKLAETIPFANSRSYSLYHVAFGYLDIARRQIREEDFDGARQSMAIAGTLDNEWGPETLGGIATTEMILARAQVAKGDSAGAQATLTEALKMATAINRPNEKYEMLQDMADAQIKAGDLAGARRSLANALQYTTIYNDAGHARMEVARAQVKAGDIAAAKQTAALVQGEPSWKYDAWRAIAEGQIKAGDMPGAQDSLRIARKTVTTYSSIDEKIQALRNIADDQFLAGDTAGAQSSIQAMLVAIDADARENLDMKSWSYQSIAELQLRMSDKTGAEATAAKIQNAKVKAKTLTDLAAPPKNPRPENPAEPMEIPRESEVQGLPFAVDAVQWEFDRQVLAKPWFTAYPDFSNYMAMASQIEKSPVQNGRQPPYRPDDKIYGLGIVCGTMVEAQSGVDGLLKMQFRL